MAGDPDPLGVDEPVQRVEGGVQAEADAGQVPGLVARARGAARPRHVRGLRRGEEEVERVLGAVDEVRRLLRGHALAVVGALAEGVGAALALDVVGEHDVAALGQERGEPPVERLGRLHGAGGEHDRGPLRRACLERPDVARERRPAAAGEEHRLDDRAGHGLLPVVEADVAGALALAVRADVAEEEALVLGRDRRSLGGDDLGEVDVVLDLLLGEAGLELGRLDDVAVALGRLGVVLDLRLGIEGERGNGRGKRDRHGQRNGERARRLPPGRVKAATVTDRAGCRATCA